MDAKLILFDLDRTLVDFNSDQPYLDVLKWFAENRDMPVAICTNQGGVGLRYWMEKDGFGEPDKYPTIQSQYQRFQRIFKALGREVDYYQSYRYQSAKGIWSPVPPSGIGDLAWTMDWRKPNPGMLQEAMNQAEEVPECTLFVGDDVTDQQAADAAGCAFMWAHEFFGRPEPMRVGK